MRRIARVGGEDDALAVGGKPAPVVNDGFVAGQRNRRGTGRIGVQQQQALAFVAAGIDAEDHAVIHRGTAQNGDLLIERGQASPVSGGEVETPDARQTGAA